MRVGRTSGQDRDAERDLSGAVVRRVAPEELGLFEEAEADYVGDPGLVRGRAPGRGGRVGPRHGPADLLTSSWSAPRSCASSPRLSPARYATRSGTNAADCPGSLGCDREHGDI